MTLDATTIRRHLTATIIKATARGDGETATPEQAAEILDNLISSDDHPDWSAVRVGHEQLATVIRHLRTLPGVGC